MNQRITVRYEGRVQGVCFRFTAIELARDLDVTGYVENLPDGSVELVAEGAEDELMSLLNAIRLSPLSRGIAAERVRRSPATGEFNTFTVRYRGLP